MALDELLAWLPLRLSRGGARPPGQFRSAAIAHRDHHGRQRPLGVAPPSSARRGTSGRHQRRPRNRRSVGAARHRRPHAVRLLDSRTGSGRKRKSATLMALLKRYLRIELGTLLQNNIRFRVIGRARDLAPDIQNELADAGPSHGEEHGAALQHRAQLQRPRRDHRRRAAMIEAGRPGHGDRRAAHSASSFTPPGSPTPIC